MESNLPGPGHVSVGVGIMTYINAPNTNTSFNAAPTWAETTKRRGVTARFRVGSYHCSGISFATAIAEFPSRCLQTVPPSSPPTPRRDRRPSVPLRRPGQQPLPPGRDTPHANGKRPRPIPPPPAAAAVPQASMTVAGHHENRSRWSSPPCCTPPLRGRAKSAR